MIGVPVADHDIVDPLQSRLLSSGIDPFRVPGQPSSGLLARVNSDAGERAGEADGKLQAYNFRMCLTDDPANRLMVQKPVGYDEDENTASVDSARTGSHNLVVGPGHQFTASGGLLAGRDNTVVSNYGSAVGGHCNAVGNQAKRSSFCAVPPLLAIGEASSVSGGLLNMATGTDASVAAGEGNEAIGFASSVSGGTDNAANGQAASILGGNLNLANGQESTVSGGEINKASEMASSIGGGEGNVASSLDQNIN